MNDYDFMEPPFAFVSDDDSGMWFFNSYYELQQQVDDDVSDTQELANLITNSGSPSVFYSFDPSFYSIMQTLSSSIALVYYPYDDLTYDNDNDNAVIGFAINGKLDKNPCWNEAVYALRSVLMWVSFNCEHELSTRCNVMQLSNDSCICTAGQILRKS